MATNTLLPRESPAKAGDSSFFDGLKQFWNEFWAPYPPPHKVLPDEMRSILQYQARRDRVLDPNPAEGEASHAHTCFFLRKYKGEREIFWVDTEIGEVRKLAFLAFWKGKPEHYDLEIGTPKP